MSREGTRAHSDLLYSVMIFMSVMHCPYDEIMNMPYKTYTKLLKYKVDFEQQKHEMLEESTRNSTAKVKNNKSMNPVANSMFN